MEKISAGFISYRKLLRGSGGSVDLKKGLLQKRREPADGRKGERR